MKKHFFEPYILYLCLLYYFVVINLFTAIIIVSWNTNLMAANRDLQFGVIFSYVALPFNIWMFITKLWERQDRLIVAGDNVTWCCLLKRRIRITFDDCKYIGVETFDKESFGLNFRGDRFAMIYLSLDPYPEEKIGRINHMHCNERFIKFPYSDKLAETLLEAAPREKTYLLRAFYSQMQRYDQQQEQNRQRRKKRRK